MPFGKYKGEPLQKVPRGYLGWVLDNCDLDGQLLIDVKALVAGQPLPRTREEKLAEIFRKR